MRQYNKAQAATEFLVTYGWAILGVMIVVAALIYFGVFDTKRYISDKCDFGTGFSCEDYILYNNGIVMFQLRNNMPVAIDYDNLTLISEFGTNTQQHVSFPVVAQPGQLSKFSLPLSGTLLNIPVNDKIRFTAIITYQRYSGGTDNTNPMHIETGEIVATVQS